MRIEKILTRVKKIYTHTYASLLNSVNQEV